MTHHQLKAMIQRCLLPILSRTQMMVGKAILKAVNDKTAIQLVKIAGIADEVQDEVERIQPYGFTTNVPLGGESIVINIGGNKDHPIVIMIDHAQYRIKNLKSGEVIMYDKTGSTILFDENGEFQFSPSGKKSTFKGEINTDDKIIATGNIESGGDVKDILGTLNEVRIDLAALKVTYNAHTHISAAPGSPTTPPLPLAT